MSRTAAARICERPPLEVVTGLVARCLRVPLCDVDTDVPLARLGLDSLGCMELAAQIEDALGRRIPSEALVERATVRSLCEALDGGDAPAMDPFARMRSDAVLADHIMPREPRRAPTDLRSARTILLTGATGFLGTSLLEELLRRSRARVICLVRATHDDPATRVRRMARELSLDAGRIEIVTADLGVDRLGLGPSEWRALASRVDAICHAGASINWITPYEGLRQVNVSSTRDLLELACDAGASFHFISSLSVCYSSAGPRRVDETFAPLASLEGLHFGYAQSKAVAESLVSEAGRRGLQTRIYRPSLISGDSRTGRFNPDDLLSTMIAGCVRMTTIPDLDWELDAVPVDSVASSIVRLSGCRQRVVHLSHSRPRHWRELALWIKLYGYPVRLVPYRAWIEQLRHDASLDVSHPLRALRPFFLDIVRDGLSIPELHEQPRRTHADGTRSQRVLSRTRQAVPSLDAPLMDRYFDAFVRAGRLRPANDSTGSAATRRDVSATSLASVRARHLLDAAEISSTGLTVAPYGAEHSIISELTAWRSGSCSGVFHVRADEREFILKMKPHARETIAVGRALAELCGGAPLGDAYARWGRALGVEEGHARELALYRNPDAVLRALMPAVIGTHADPAAGEWSMLLEKVPDRPARWGSRHVDASIDGLACLHARWYGRTDAIRAQPWIGVVRGTNDFLSMEPLWRALAAHAAPFIATVEPSLVSLQRRLLDRMDAWKPLADGVRATLVHNDFNPRNIRLRREDGMWRLRAFDWELSTIGAPTRDLAELLCFVCGPATARERVDRWLERHRRRVAAQSGNAIARGAWRAAFASSLCELLIDRLAVYALVHRVKPQPFLPRVLRTWSMLFGMVHDAIPA